MCLKEVVLEDLDASKEKSRRLLKSSLMAAKFFIITGRTCIWCCYPSFISKQLGLISRSCGPHSSFLFTGKDGWRSQWYYLSFKTADQAGIIVRALGKFTHSLVIISIGVKNNVCFHPKFEAKALKAISYSRKGGRNWDIVKRPWISLRSTRYILWLSSNWRLMP